MIMLLLLMMMMMMMNTGIKKPKKTSAAIWLLGVTLVTLDKHQMDSTV